MGEVEEDLGRDGRGEEEGGGGGSNEHKEAEAQVEEPLQRGEEGTPSGKGKDKPVHRT